ncbi:hypothetical protein ACIRS1_17425 [Kitasatospora sp. NPDC101176]|uniref:hypothetical protein n=1 Tax=Kitasatospora sp. NPDC101176 TaxID=3364099 RepID=UPI00382AEDAD
MRRTAVPLALAVLLGLAGCDPRTDPGRSLPPDDRPGYAVPTPSPPGTVMPELRGQSVLAARSLLPLWYPVTVRDADQRGRVVVVQWQWRVCTQDPAAGTALTGQVVALRAMLAEESCP